MYSKDELALIWLDLFASLTYKKKEQLLALVDSPAKLTKEFDSLQNKITTIIDEKLFIKMQKARDEATLKSHLTSLEKQNIIAVTLMSDDYPEKLRHVDCPPYVLYCIGDKKLLNSNCLAVVGTRKMTNYGKTITDKFACDLARAGFTIVSGLCYGVDTVAHEAALNCSGKTIAVLAGGVDKIYPASNFNLAQKIIKNGLLVSENPPGSQTFKYSFAIRNRIVAALSKGVLITEADEKSGAMHTKNYALDNNIDVYAVPGNVTSATSKGTNNLIKLGHSQCVTETNDILANFNMQISMELPKTEKYEGNEKLIVDLLKKGEHSFEELITITKIDAKTLNTCLTTLRVCGTIKKLAGNIYTL